ncbi:MAG: DUF5668 domain-containing protein [Thermoanaerobaculales bacterium]|nr:DUF5668 domain-containing protein [Thermoanaerobaculales bacterium]
MSDKEKIDSTPMPPAPGPKEDTPVTPPSPPVVPPAPQPPVQEAIERRDSHEEYPESNRAKSSVAAAILALVPFGLGHLYLGQYSRAVALFAAFWVPMLVLELPLVAVFFYFFAIFDAYRQAQLINLADERGEELPATTFSGGLTAGVFLIVLGAVLMLRNWIDFYFIREFLQDWWPGLLVIMGAWFIYGAVKENRQSGESDEVEPY